MIANKTDLAEERVISTEQGKKKAVECDVHFMEASAATGDGI